MFLKRIESESANVTWRFRGERAGFFGTQLLITPHGPDFEYRATGGTLKMALVPDLYLRGAHLLVTNALLTIYDVDLAPNAQSDGSIHGRGTSGIEKIKSRLREFRSCPDPHLVASEMERAFEWQRFR